MPSHQIKKVNTLPAELVENVIYFVKSSNTGYVDTVVTGISSLTHKKIVSQSDVLSSISKKGVVSNSSGLLSNDLINIAPNITAASLHQSPNAVIQLFIYDTNTDADLGAWTMKCRHTSWYKETLSGKWLGPVASESAARAVSSATTNDYFQLTTDGKFYKLNAGSGTTEVFRGNKANFPRIAGIVLDLYYITIYDLTEPNYPMWMVFPPVVASVLGMASGYPPTSITAMHGVMAVGYNGTGLTRVSFIEDKSIINDISTNSGICRVPISNRTLSNVGYQLLANTALPSRIVNDVALAVLPTTSINNYLTMPVTAVATGAGLVFITGNNVVRTSSDTAAFTYVKMDSKILIGAKNTTNTVQYIDIKSITTTGFVLTTYTPYVGFGLNAGTALSKQSKITSVSYPSVLNTKLNKANSAKSLACKISNSEQTGWLVGDIRRCYMGDNQASSMLTSTLIPPISNAKFIQRLGNEASIFSLAYLGNGIVLASTNPTGQIYRSIDNGLTWVLVQRLGTETHARALTYIGNGIVIAGTALSAAQVYRSTDYGLTWTLVCYTGLETYVYSVVSLGNGIVLVGTSSTGKIYYSTDNGASFTSFIILQNVTSILALLNLDNGIVLAGTYPTGQIYRSTDAGLTWTLVQRLGSETQVRSLLYLGNGIVLAGTATTGQIYRSTDNGLSFTLVQRLGNESYVYSLVYLGNSIVLAGTYPTGQIYRSTDNGLSFTLVQRLGTASHALSLVSLGNGIALAGTYPPGQIYRYTFPVITGTLTKTAVATNADLTAYSGFSNTNYVREAYSSDLDFGTAEWSMSAWIKIPAANAAIGTILYRGHTGGPYIALTVTAANYLSATAYDGTTTRTVTSVNAYNLDTWVKVRANYRTDGSLSLSVNGVDEATTYGTPLLTLNNANAVLTLGNNYALDAPFPGSLCLVKLSATVPTPDQMAFMFAEESQLFRDNAKCTLPDNNDILDISYDSLTDSQYVVTGTKRTLIKGLLINNDVTLSSGSYNNIEINSGVTLDARIDSGTKVYVTTPYKSVAGYLSKYDNKNPIITVLDYVGGFTATTYGTATAFLALAQTTSAWKGIAVYKGDVYACVYGGDIYKQTAMSGAFSATNQTSRNWNGMAASSNAMYAYVYNGDIYKYNPATGVFDPLNQTSRQWTGMAVSGNDVYACARGVDIYKQTNGTGDFVALGEQTLLWSGMTALNGNIYACVDGGDIYKQTNATGAFTALGQTSRYWTDMCSTLTDVYACVASGDIYKQTNATGTFTATSQTSRAWSGLASYGTDVYATVDAGDIYKLNLNSTLIGSISGLSVPSQTTYVNAVISGTGIQTDTQLYSVSSTNGYLSKPTTASGSSVQIAFKDFILPIGYKTLDVMVNGVMKQEGSTKDYTRLHDGFRETVRFNTAPGYNAWVQFKVAQDN